jgi:D-sedoheptulose 7-phosphate isomerase
MPDTTHEAIRTHIMDSVGVKWEVYRSCIEEIGEAVDLIKSAFEAGSKLLICGNGGSAADSQHLAAEFVPHGLPAVALTTDTSFMTAYSNDVNFAWVFSKQVNVIGKPGDVLIGITTSGKSINVIRAIKEANSKGMRTIALTGESGLRETFADVNIRVPSTNTQYIQEAHLMIEHIIYLQVVSQIALV